MSLFKLAICARSCWVFANSWRSLIESSRKPFATSVLSVKRSIPTIRLLYHFLTPSVLNSEAATKP